MSERRVVVTGLGAVTALGGDVAGTWSGLLAGRCGIRTLTLFDPALYRTQTAAQIDEIPDSFIDPARRRRMSRADRIGIVAAREALAQAGIDPAREDPTRIGVILGGGVSGLIDSEANYARMLAGRPARPSGFLNHQPDAITDRLSEYFGLRGIKSTITTACSSSAVSMGYAYDAIGGDSPTSSSPAVDVLARRDLRRLQFAPLGRSESVPPLRPEPRACRSARSPGSSSSRTPSAPAGAAR
jgi:3-oxoacyl-[acyl-carrier-protein] synthase II